MRYLALGLMLCLAGAAQAATIHLKEGGTIEGTIVSSTAQDVIVQTGGSTVSIATDRIRRIDYEQAVPPTPDGTWRGARVSPQYEERQMFSFNLGLASPLSEVDFSAAGGGRDDNGDAGLLIGVQYLYFTHPRWGWGFNIEHTGRSRSNSFSLLPGAETSVGGRSFGILGVTRFNVVDHGMTRPYLLAGLGAAHTTTRIDAAPHVGFTWSDTGTAETRRLVSGNSWGLAATTRLGIEFMADLPTTLALELGWNGFYNKRPSATAAGNDLGLTSVSGNISAFTVAARWGWKF